MSEFNKRSTGDVAAPLVENECCKCKAKLMRRDKSDSYICDDCFDIMQSDGGEVALAVKLERAAVVKYLRDEADELSATGSKTLDVVAQSLRARAGHIEKGEHLK